MTDEPREAEETVGPPGPILTYRRVMGARLYLHTWVRLAVAVTIALGALAAKHVVGIEGIDVVPLVSLAVVIAGYNAVAWFLTRRYRHRELSRADWSEAHRRLERTMVAALLLDYVALTVAIWLVGGARSPFLAFYVLHVILSCLYLSRGAAIASAALAYALLAALTVGELTGVIPPHLPIGAVSSADPLDGRHALTVLVVYGMLFGLAAFLLVTLSGELRRGEQRLRAARRELMRLSEMRKDFLHVAVHNLRSPLGVTTMFLEHLRAGLGGPVTEQQARWIDTGLRRLDELQVFLLDLQTFSSLEADELTARREEVDIAAILRKVVDEHRDMADQRGHELTLELPERTLPVVHGIPRLLREAVVNYVTNAIKYTPEGGHVVVRAAAGPGVVRIEVEDDGIGIHPSDRSKLFSEFYRGKREGTPVADAQGTGLGLSIVKRVAEAHGGRVDVESEPGASSTFILELPARDGP